MPWFVCANRNGKNDQCPEKTGGKERGGCSSRLNQHEAVKVSIISLPGRAAGSKVLAATKVTEKATYATRADILFIGIAPNSMFPDLEVTP